MGGKNVKNTIVEKLMEMVAPHPCSGCGKTGILLCDNCKYDISLEPFIGCILCGHPQRRGVCDEHHAPFEQAFVVSKRSDVLKELIDGLKFHNQKAAARHLAELLDKRLPILPIGACIVPIPTAPSHVRQRGYDQVDLIARYLSSIRGLPIEKLLLRKSNATQHTAGRQLRLEQAQTAYSLQPEASITKDAYYILLDDVVTTGATVTQAASAIKAAGGRVIVAALAYQPLD